MGGARRGAGPRLRGELPHGQRVVGVARVGADGVAGRRGGRVGGGGGERGQRAEPAGAGGGVERRVGVAVAGRVAELLQLDVLLRAGRLRRRQRQRDRARRRRQGFHVANALLLPPTNR